MKSSLNRRGARAALQRGGPDTMVDEIGSGVLDNQAFDTRSQSKYHQPARLATRSK